MLETSQFRFIERGRVKIKNIHIPQIFVFRRIVGFTLELKYVSLILRI
jgi:hypothetical protein